MPDVCNEKRLDITFKNGLMRMKDHECYYNIGMIYYSGNENIPLKKNKHKAFYGFKLAAAQGNTTSLYKLSKLYKMSTEQSLVFLKATSSLDYPLGYFDGKYTYRNFETNIVGKSKLKTIRKLGRIWDEETDPATVRLKNQAKKISIFHKTLLKS